MHNELTMTDELMIRNEPVIYSELAMGSESIIPSIGKRRKMELFDFLPAISAGVWVVLLILAVRTIMLLVHQPAEAVEIETIKTIETVADLVETAETAAAAAAEEDPLPARILPDGTVRIPGVPLIAVDPGHGGTDDGCLAAGIAEKEINLEIARLLQTRLTEMGYQVMLTRADDTYITKEERVEMANHYQPDIYVSIHQNTYEGAAADASGIEIWYDGADTARDNQRLAQLIHQETISNTGASPREIRDEADFTVTGKTDMPACLIETGFLSHPAERTQLLTTEYREKIAAGIANGIDLYFNPKTMYLTFDDGPSATNTDAILDILKDRNIKATFFVIGEYVEKNPETAKRIVAEGHAVGIHCYRHDYNNLYASVESYLEDFEKARETVLRITGVETNMFRFPGGSVNAYNKKVSKEIVEAMTALGFVYYDWNASLEDAAVRNTEPEQLITNAKDSILGRKKIILLAHDTVYNTTLCLNDLLDQFPEYQMALLTDEIAPIQFHQ